MLIRIDPGSDRPLFEQIASAVRSQIALGQALPGERLPSAKDLADQLGVNLHTVLKAYQELRDEELIELRRGRGALVSANAGKLGALTTATDRLLKVAESQGLGLESVLALVRARASGRPRT